VRRSRASRAAAPEQLTGDPHLRRLLAAGQPAAEPLEPDAAVECAQRHRQRRIELVQVPAQALPAAASLGDQVVSMIEQPFQLAQPLLACARPVEVGLLQRGPRDRERIERIRLAAHAAATTRRSGQPRRHAHQPLARFEQQPL